MQYITSAEDFDIIRSNPESSYSIAIQERAMKKCRSRCWGFLFLLLAFSLFYLYGDSLMKWIAVKKIRGKMELNGNCMLITQEYVARARSQCLQLLEENAGSLHCGVAIGFTESVSGFYCRPLDNDQTRCFDHFSPNLTSPGPINKCSFSRSDRHLYHYCITDSNGDILHYHQPVITTKGSEYRNTVETFSQCGKQAKRTRSTRVVVSHYVSDTHDSYVTTLNVVRNRSIAVCLQHYAEALSPLFDCSDLMGLTKEDL
jgi:hypothetical protein